MTSETFHASLGGMQRRKPFRSFTVELVSGEQIVVDHPEALVMRGGLAVFIDAKGIPTLFDHESVSRLVGEDVKNPAA
jgi:hypothetical protein